MNFHLAVRALNRIIESHTAKECQDQDSGFFLGVVGFFFPLQRYFLLWYIQIAAHFKITASSMRTYSIYLLNIKNHLLM